MKFVFTVIVLLALSGCQSNIETQSHDVPASKTSEELAIFSAEVPENSNATFFQRLSKNNHWDDGRELESKIAKKMLRLIEGSIEYDPVAANDVVAYGVLGPNYYEPPFTSAVELKKPGEESGLHITFCADVEHFMDDSDTFFVVPEKHRKELRSVLESVHGELRNMPF